MGEVIEKGSSLLRSSAITRLLFSHDNAWATPHLVRKRKRVRLMPVPAWVKERLDAWITAGEIREKRTSIASPQGKCRAVLTSYAHIWTNSEENESAIVLPQGDSRRLVGVALVIHSRQSLIV